jgi:FlaA1/EpsC-like NDP-sugar epimerase
LAARPVISEFKHGIHGLKSANGRRLDADMRKRMKAALRSNTTRWIFLLLAQASMFTLAGLVAFLLRFDFRLPQVDAHYLACALPMWIIVKSIAFQFAKLNRRGLRYVSIDDVYRLVIANAAGSAVSCLLILIITPSGFPRSIYFSDLILSILSTAGLRVVIRMVFEGMNSGQALVPEKRTFIYGAGNAGITLLREVHNNVRLAYRVCGFFDDDVHKQGMVISGLQVYEGGDKLRELAASHEIELVLIAIPSATGPQMTRILGLCHAADVECKTVPGLGDVIEDSGLVGQIRDVAVEDLLGRTPVHLQESAIRGTIEGKIVMVTGAAGSIGSELCRQIARFRPAGIVGFEIAESPLFEIDREMKQKFPAIPFYPEIGSIQSRARISEVLSQYRPAVVYHAAAYKHVPLMEQHVFEAIENNVFGTYNVALAAKDYRVESFVLISSDKAVRPTNVMGATKRVAELLLQTLQNGGTQYVMVRFGNVLGSSGSVIPIFKKQIAAGGPVTVTHPDMRRYFMTIPEACQLVLQAAAIGHGGQICVLDMGQPVKIADLARDLILLSGFKPDEDIRIEYTGIRPGEKLCEELSTLLEDTVPTGHSKIRIYAGNGFPHDNLEQWLNSLGEICHSRDLGQLLMALKETVMDYNPSTDVLKRIIQPKNAGHSSASMHAPREEQVTAE